MDYFRKFIAITIAVIGFASLNASAAIDNAASVVLLRTSCNDGAGGTLNNCFITTNTLVSWVANTRNPKPNASAPLTIEIGPGTFSGFAIGCNTEFTGYVTFRGAGRDVTNISGAVVFPTYTLGLYGCTSLLFEDLTIGPVGGGIWWTGQGTSTWENVNVFHTGYGWNEVSSCSGSGERGKHYWFSSRIVGSENGGFSRPYQSRCAEDWFIGSEITIKPTSNIGFDAFALHSIGTSSEIHYYGGVLRALAGPGIGVPAFGASASFRYGLAAAVAEDGGQIHIHGTGIDVLSSDGNPVSSLGVLSGGFIHANGSAYNLATGTGGSVTRVNNQGGHIHAPYLWEHVPDPATAPNFASANGADQTTVTSGTSDGHPHMAVYSSTCPSNARWYDQVDKTCRSQ